MRKTLIFTFSEDGHKVELTAEQIVKDLKSGALHLIEDPDYVLDFIFENYGKENGDMEQTIFFTDREIAKETLWWMMGEAGEDRFKVDKVRILKDPIEGYGYIDFRYFREDDDYEVQQHAKDFRDWMESERKSPDDLNIQMLDIIKTFIKIEEAYADSKIDAECHELIVDMLDTRVHDICSEPPGPSVHLVELYQKYFDEYNEED